MISQEVIARHASFLHHPERVLHMLRNQSALAVREPHKAALWGFVQQALATFSEHPDTLHQPAVRKVLRDNLLLAMGTMLEEAQPMVSAESVSHQSYRRLLAQAREYVLENSAEPLTVLICASSCTSAVAPCKTPSMRYWGLVLTPGSNGSA